MIMNLSGFKILLLLMFLCFFSELKAKDRQLNTDIDKKQKTLLQQVRPEYMKVQFAGMMGVVSLGAGWDYGKRHWETDLFLGYVSRDKGRIHQYKREIMPIITIKQNYIPWRVPLNKHFLFEPLTSSLYLNAVLNNNYWVKAPSKYPKDYYFFSTKIRTLLAVGERLRFKADKSRKWKRDVTFFYEISTCDLYVLSAINDKGVNPKDIFNLSLGVKIQLY